MSLEDLQTDIDVRSVMNPIRAAIQKWLSAVFKGDYEVIPAELSTPRPYPPYITFKLLVASAKVGAVDEIIPQKDNGVEIESAKVISTKLMTLSIQTFGRADEDYEKAVSAMDMAMSIQNSIDLPTIKEFLRENNIGIVEDNAIQDISEIVDTETEPRAVYDLVLNVRISTEDDQVTYIESAEFSGEFDTDMDGDYDKSTGTVAVN